jgi:histidine ammonia-lyase
LNWAVIFSTAINEIVGAFNDHFSEGLNEVKLHAGQRDVALTMRKITRDSKLIKNRHAVFYSAGDAIKKDFFKEKVQEYYSLRCVPQILGPILDTIRYANNIVSNEINSVNDNPVIDHNRQDVLHGGNFHGDYVSLEMDKLRIVITKLAMLCERQLNYLLNDRLNQKLPPFLNLGTLGLNYGMQGMQFTATSTVAECQTLSMSAYVHSIPNNNDNQDIVSMGTNSALLTSKVIDNAFEVLAIHAIAVIQAVDGSNCKKGLSTFSSKTYSDLRKICPKFVHDEAKSETIAKMKRFLMSNHPNLIQS